MPRTSRPAHASLGYSLGDVLRLTTATKSHMQHWLKTGIIAGDVMDREGRGRHRRFSTFNLIEIQVCATVNRYHVPAELIRVAANVFRVFHLGAVAFHEEVKNVAFDASAVRVVTPGTVGSAPRRAGLFANPWQRNVAAQMFERSCRESSRDPRVAARVWNVLRTSRFIQGGDVRDADKWFRHFVGLFISDESAEVAIDPKDIHGVIGESAIVLDVEDIVWNVGERARLNSVVLEPW